MLNRKKIIKEIGSWILTVLMAFFIVTLLNSEVYARVQVQQNSMEDTLFNNQQLIVDKLSYNFVAPKRGEIVIFFENKKRVGVCDDIKNTINRLLSKDQDSVSLIKRIIGIPGDVVDIKGGSVYVNEVILNEPYVKGETFKREIQFPIQVGEGELLVLGDNRPVSMDSRTFGLIDYNQVEGKAIFGIFKPNKAGVLKNEFK